MGLMTSTSWKKTAVFFFVLMFIFSNARAFAQVPVPLAGVGSALNDLAKIGVVAATRGKVEVTTPGAAGRVVQSGEEIFIGDEVKTDAVGHLQILLLDETVFTIGPNSAITIDKFIYDPGTHVGKMQASVAKGVFRYVSGKIAANKPENVTINLPAATIGVRGTIIAGEVSQAGSMAMLLGPGSNNETGATIGSFVMTGTGENSGQQQHVDRTGFGVNVGSNGSVSNVFMVPETQVQHLGTALLPAPSFSPAPLTGPNPSPSSSGPVPGSPQPPPGPGQGPGPATGPAPGGAVTGPVMTTGVFGANFNAGQTSGAQTYAGFQTTQTANMMGTLQTSLMQDSTLASQDALHNAATQLPTQRVRDTLNRDMIARVASIVTYQHFGGQFIFNNLPGTLNAVITVDFATDKIIGAQSHIDIIVPDGITAGTELKDNCTLTDQAFNPSNPLGLATFNWNTPTINNGGPPNFDSLGNFTQVTVQFQDIEKTLADGTTQVDLAAQAKVDVTYSRSPYVASSTVIAPQS